MILFFIILIIAANSLSEISKEYTNLINWIETNNGYISKKIKPIEESKYNRMIKSFEKIEKNELIAFIPEPLIISSINYLVNPICRSAYGLNYDNFLECIALYFTLDRNNINSFFKPYYDYLPEFDIKIFPSEFPKEEQKLYEEIDLNLHIGVHDHKLEMAYNEYVEAILLKNKIENGYEKYKYNFYLAHSRDFSRVNSEILSDINSMVPFMDLFNHDNNYNLDWEYSDKKKGFILKAIKNIDSEELLTISYGENNNIDLFTTYGFTLKNNIYKIPIRIKPNEFHYTLYPSENDKKMKESIENIIKALKERYGFEKDKENFIYNLILNGLEEKLKKINLIKLDNENIRNIVEEEKSNLLKYICILEKDYLSNNLK